MWSLAGAGDETGEVEMDSGRGVIITYLIQCLVLPVEFQEKECLGFCS